MRYRQAVVIGSSEEDLYRNEAFEIGRYIAKNGWVLISGGRGGIMEAASMGASQEKGIVIGIIPDSDPNSANKYCNVVVPTGIGYARNMINVLSGDVIIAIGGKSGTLSELAYAWLFKRPIILCAFAGGWSKRLSISPIDDRVGEALYVANSLEEVYKFIDEVLQ